MIEEWRAVVGYEGLYEVSSFGRVRGIDRIVPSRWGTSFAYRGRVLRPNALPTQRYISVELHKGGKSSRCTVHRLVAFAFVPTVDGKPHVNHKDGVRSNNVPDNLEWVTPSENERYSYRVLGKKQIGKPVIAFNETGELRFESATAAKKHGFYQGAIRGVLKGTCKTHAGYYWRYA